MRLQGYRYCDLLLSRRQVAAARNRAIRNIKIAQRNKWVLATALDALTLGRAHLALGLASGSSAESANAEALAGGSAIEEAVEGLRASGQYDYVARGLLARAALRRAVGDWAGVARDLGEAQEIAEPGPMRLYLCDIALEQARLALAGREAFAPLNGLVEPSPPPPVLTDAAAAAALQEEARKELDIARRLIAVCGYHQRDEELSELDDVVAGRRRFADLPPRV